ncbi:hypothetical protein EYF80_004694 [Liparis tanakae]|uniref:Uncharacterized protein n=1 Tax=Liparis tanakae TaxID=230148 RepID=A0A4Z2J4D1_9TELE|nr:hypothetical protein EYF80_004694 [Liparis tanakae]
MVQSLDCVGWCVMFIDDVVTDGTGIKDLFIPLLCLRVTKMSIVEEQQGDLKVPSAQDEIREKSCMWWRGGATVGSLLRSLQAFRSKGSSETGNRMGEWRTRVGAG